MDIKKKIADIAARLEWIVEYKYTGRDLEITSNPWTKTHTIKVPVEGADWRDIEYLHELAHATLAEKHHLLATGWFVKEGTDNKTVEVLVNPMRVASDWFADDLLMQWCPVEEGNEIREHAGYAIDYNSRHDPELIYGGGLFLAQSVHYLGTKIHTIPRKYRPVVNILLTVDPGKPDVLIKRDLINRLAALTCSQRVRLVQENKMDVWEIKKG